MNKNKIYIFSIIFFVMLGLAGCNDDDEVQVETEEVEETEETNEESDSSVEILTTDGGIDFVRTPEAQFENLSDWPYEAQFVEIDGLQQAYYETGPTDGDVVLLLHGQPSWSYLYRKMMPVLADAGYRVIAMDHLGMGQSDKPVSIDDYTYLNHYDRILSFIQLLNLQDVNLFVQDWGSLIGLRVAGLNPELFATIAAGNAALPVESEPPFPDVENPDEVVDLPSLFSQIPAQQFPFYDGCDPLFSGDQEGGFFDWMTYALKAESFIPSEVVEAWTWFDLTVEEENAYDAPFPSREYMAGVRKFPSLINELAGQNDLAWQGLQSFEKPFITIWGGNDIGSLGSCEAQELLIANVPGASGQAHDRLPEAGHFLQDDQGVEIANRLIDFYEQGDSQNNSSVVYEIFQVVSETEIIVWANTDNMSQDEFDALELPSDWSKNQPRETLWDGGEFASSPGQEAGVFVNEELFGFQWQHVATVGERGYPMDPDSILVGSDVFKNHTVFYNQGSTIRLVISPAGETYVFGTRDFNRTTDVPTLPEGWQEAEFIAEADIQIQLPNPTVNIRADNQDSFQGPVTEEDFQPRQ